MRPIVVVTTALVSFALAGCDDGPPVEPALARGRQTYQTICISCHNANPALAGSVGPPLKNMARAILEAKLLHGEYPAGYTPRRDTKMMPTQPQLAPALDDLALFLQ